MRTPREGAHTQEGHAQRSSQLLGQRTAVTFSLTQRAPIDLSTCGEGFSTVNIGHREHDVVLGNRERAAVKEDAVPGNVSLRRNLGWASKSWLPRHLLPCAAV